MSKPKRSRYAVYRDRLRGGPPRVPAPCGTWPAVRRHQRKGEALDAKCAQAMADHNRVMYERRKNRP